MEKFMRNTPSLAVLVVLVIQITRVSEFGGRIGAGWLAPVFAFFLAGCIYVLSYWNGRTRYTVTAEASDRQKHAQQMRMKRLYDDVNKTTGGWLFLFVLIEGFLNLTETMSNLPGGASVWETAGALMYGAFPTLAAFGLGTMQALLDRIPHGTSKSAVESLFDKAAKRMETLIDGDAPQEKPTAPDSVPTAPQSAQVRRNADAYPKACPHACGASLANANAYSAHMRWCENRPAQKETHAADDAPIPVRIPTLSLVERMDAIFGSDSPKNG